MRTLNVIMSMAGEGSRFKQVGIDIPKPLIKANGVPFFVRALYGVKDQFNLDDIKITCVIQKKHAVKYNLDGEIWKNFHANIAVINEPTRGAVETCLAAHTFIADSDAILILDCDLEWHCHNYMSMIAKLLQEDTSSIGGMLLSFESNDPRYSYAVVENGIVTRTAEKEPISNNALVGAYYFNTADDFFDSAFNLFENNELSDIKEYYVSLLYNYLIKSGKIVKLHKVDSLHSFGTPEELNHYAQLNK